MGASTRRKIAPPLAAVVGLDSVAVLLGLDVPSAYADARAGRFPGAVQTLGSAGFCLGWRTVEERLGERLDGEALRLAKADLLALRAGTSRRRGECFEPVPALTSALDELGDTELGQLLDQARADLDELTEDSFGAWAAERGRAIGLRDIMVRLSAVHPTSSGGTSSQPALPATDTASTPVTDPLDALLEAARWTNAPDGSRLTVARFEAWARAAGSPLRAYEVRRLFGSWTDAKQRAGLVVRGRATQKRTQ